MSKSERKEIRELRGYVEQIVEILELAYEHISTINHSCNCLREDLEMAIAQDLLKIEEEC